MKIYIDQYLLKMPQVRSISESICDDITFFRMSAEPPEAPSWTLAWGYPATKRRFGVAETGFFWDAMHIDTQGLYQFSSLNSSIGRSEIDRYSAPVSARELMAQSSLPQSKYRQPVEAKQWKGVVFASQNPEDRSVHSVASTDDWWRFYEESCRYYGSQLYVKLHPWNQGATEQRLKEIAHQYQCEIGHAGHSILENCEHVILFTSSFSVDCMLRGVPVKQGAPGYFFQTGAVTYCANNPRVPLLDTQAQASQLVDFLVWKYCFSMDCNQVEWENRLEMFANSRHLFPMPESQSYGSYLNSKIPDCSESLK